MVVKGLRRVGALSTIAATVLAAVAIQADVALAARAPAQQAADPQPVGVAGVIRQVADTPDIAPGAVRVDLGARTVHRGQGAPTAAAPFVTAAVAATAARDKLLKSFNGTSSLDSAITNFGAEFEPPDQGLCAGNGFVVDMVNSAYRVYDTNGVSLAGPFNINKPFHDGFHQFTSDPRCYFDSSTNTWFAVILFLNNSFTLSRVDIAVNTTGDPTTPWNVFRIDTNHIGGPGCPCFGDQPTLGIDDQNLYVTTNEFSIRKPNFNGAQIYAIDKAGLIAHTTSVHFVQFTNLFVGGAMAASVQPAITTGASSAEYFLSSLDPNATVDNRLGVWAMTNRQAVAMGHVPTLSHVVIRSESYANPTPAHQMGSTSRIDSGDDRMQQVQFIGGSIWGALGTSVQTADPAPRAAAAWFRVTPTLAGSKLAGATIAGQGYVMSPAEYVIYPAIQADSAGHAAMVFTLTGAERFPSAAYAVLDGSGTAFGAPIVAAKGTGPYDPKATRWGDYSFAVLDPATDSVWMATEYIPGRASQTTDRKRNWGTRVLQVSLSS